MKKLWVVVFVIALIIIAVFTFKHQPTFSNSGAVIQLMETLSI